MAIEKVFVISVVNDMTNNQPIFFISMTNCLQALEMLLFVVMPLNVLHTCIFCHMSFVIHSLAVVTSEW